MRSGTDGDLEMTPLALTVAQVAVCAQTSERLVYDEINLGRLRAVHVGRLIRVPVSAVAEWLGEDADRVEAKLLDVVEAGS